MRPRPHTAAGAARNLLAPTPPPGEYGAMRVNVFVPGWVLVEDMWVVTVGDALDCWLTFEEAGRWAVPLERLHRVEGIAASLPGWPGRERDRYPVRIDVGGAALYWDAPTDVQGRVGPVGHVEFNNVDAPEGFPQTRGIVRAVRMEWRDYVSDNGVEWVPADDRAQYGRVEASTVPFGDDQPPMRGRRTVWTGVLLDLEVGGG